MAKTETAIVQRIQQNWSETGRALGSTFSDWNGALIHTKLGMSRGGGFWNIALTANCRPEKAESVLVYVRDHFNSRSLPYAIYTFDGQFTFEFEKFTGKFGIFRSNTQTVMTLSRATRNVPREKIRRIDLRQGSDWVHVMGLVFERSGALLRALGKCYAAAAAEFPDSARFYVAESDGKVVGTAFAYFDGKVVGIHNVGVLAEHRRQGFGKALTLAAVNDAIADGAQFVWLRTITGEFAETLYAQLGFQALTHCHAFRPRNSP